MYKGDKVRLHQKLDNGLVQRGLRATTRDEIDAWYASDDSKGMNCAGETKLPPLTVAVEIVPGREYLVLRARCRPQLGYYPRPGMALVRCPVSGTEFYIKRTMLEVV